MTNNNTATSLLDSARRLNKLAPWQWLTTYDIFGIKLPNYDQVFYCVILGTDAEEFGLVINDGVEGLLSYMQLFSAESNLELMYEQKALAVYFNNRNELQKDDYQFIKQTNLTFRGKKQWPSFRKFKPGYLPTIPNEQEQQLIQQIIEVALKLTIDLKQYVNEEPLFAQDLCLTRNVTLNNYKDEKINYSDIFDNYQRIINVPVAYDEFSIKRIKKQVKEIDSIWEIDTMYYPYAVEEDGVAFYPVNFLMLDIESQLIIGQHLTTPTKKAEEIQKYILDYLDNHKEVPKQIAIANEDLYYYLVDMFKELGVNMIFVEKLQLMPYVKEEILEMLNNSMS